MAEKDQNNVIHKMVESDKTKTFGDSVQFNPDETRGKLPNIPPPPKSQED